jgi:hypothetical protein
MRALIGALVLLAATPAAADPPRSFAGLYRINQMEMAGGLELSPNGRFRYALEYGAVSEEGEGKWRRSGKVVLLTSDPMPTAPDFKVVRDDPAPKGEIVVQLEPPGFGSMGDRVEVLFTAKGHGYPDIYHLDLDGDGRATLPSGVPVLIIPKVPVFGDLGTAIPLSPDRGHKLLLRFLPNDLGKPRFNAQRLVPEGETLILYRYDATIVLKPVQPRPR